MRGDYPPLRHLGATLYLILTKNINKLPSLWFFGQCQRTASAERQNFEKILSNH